MTEEKTTVPTITRKDVTLLETPLMITAMRYGFATKGKTVNGGDKVDHVGGSTA